MEILIGTSNPSKVDFFRQVLRRPDIRLLTPAEKGIGGEPAETGRTPVENALLKARFYGRYAENVICADSGLCFAELPMDDPRQPGLHVRTPGGGPRLDDEAMIAHYAALVHSLGGRVTAYYLDGMALKLGEAYHTFEQTREEGLRTAFTLIDTPVPERRPGWPLDSLSLDREGRSFLAPRPVDPQQQWAYRERLHRFFAEKLG